MRTTPALTLLPAFALRAGLRATMGRPAGTPRRRRLLLVLLASLLASASAAADSEPGAARQAEYRIKSAFLFHFCNYVEWPPSAFASPDSPLVIGVAGPPDVVAQLRDAVAGRRAGERPIEVRALERGSALDALHVLYIAAPAQFPAFRSALAGDTALLVVTETAGGLDAGGVINFVVEDDRVRFDIAPANARLRGLDVGAQLLTVARRILDESVADDGP